MKFSNLAYFLGFSCSILKNKNNQVVSRGESLSVQYVSMSNLKLHISQQFNFDSNDMIIICAGPATPVIFKRNNFKVLKVLLFLFENFGSFAFF